MVIQINGPVLGDQMQRGHAQFPNVGIFAPAPISAPMCLSVNAMATIRYPVSMMSPHDLDL